MDTRLDSLIVLVMDCQATGASPPKGHLLEIGWAALAADRLDRSAAEKVDSYLVQPPDDTAIPAAVTRVTGIDTASLADALPASCVWQHLDACVRSTAAEAEQVTCPTVIHFARFETPFLKDLYTGFASEQAFPLQVVCTHEISRRLFPGLPRKGLRAVAGYLGYSVGSQRRCTAHVQATAVIWRHLVKQLKETHSIDSWAALRDWLANTPPPHRPARSYPLNPALRQKLPDQPGIYRMRRSNGDLLYVGKATSLKTRVNSYFRPKARHAEHTLEMLSQARKLEVTTTATALEAAVLECDLIKKHAPPYNVALKRAHRGLSYCDHNLSQWAATAPDRRWVGPFPSQREAESLTAISNWWSDPARTPADTGMAILNLPQSYQPPVDCARDGLALFYQTHADVLMNNSPLRAIAAMGAGFWRERLKAAEEQENTPIEKDPDEEGLPEASEHVWSPEAVQRTIEHIIRHAAHMMRRARWFCQLSESNLLWEARSNGPSQRLAKIRAGQLAGCRDHAADKKPPIPTTKSIPLAQRKQHLDGATYDRLRVITTEVRRLVAEKRRPTVCLGNGRILDEDQLRRLLKWV